MLGFTYFLFSKSQDESIDDFLAKLQDLRVEVYTRGNKIQAYVTCPVCDQSKQSKISLNMDTTGSWHIFAFKRHCETFHIQQPHSSGRNRRSISPDITGEDESAAKRPFLDSTTGGVHGTLKQTDSVRKL